VLFLNGFLRFPFKVIDTFFTPRIGFKCDWLVFSSAVLQLSTADWAFGMGKQPRAERSFANQGTGCVLSSGKQGEGIGFWSNLTSFDGWLGC
jgi:hypothetical protein